ncbi:MAG: M28 family peptidase [Phycisphaerales bacterium]|nr:M28 family peptidase [Phycisphaerae bacterium]NNF44347.1 M28 family peptidase [Phycisphaerales bacterium]NNM27715.1 M28 family peptidase [Phycisphaerales bacterium]
MPTTHRLTRPLVLSLLLLAGGCAHLHTETTSVARPVAAPPTDASMAAPPAAPTPAAAATSGRIERGPASITTFRPDEESTRVDPHAIDYKTLFEDLGPVASEWYQHVQTLANPYFEGRVNGSAGTERARDYLEFHFRRAGLEPAFPATDEMLGGAAETMASFMQPFEFNAGRGFEVTIEEAHAAVGGNALVEGTDYVVLGNSGSSAASGPVTFVGYGIADGPDGYSSFDEDTDLTGRIALVLRYEPLDEEGSSQWAEERFSPNAGIARKMRAVIDRGAAGVILVNPPDCVDGREGLEPIDRSARFGRQIDVPAIQMTPEAAARLLAAGDREGGDLLHWRRQADTAAITTVDLDGVEVELAATLERKRAGQPMPAENVGAVLPGRGNLADEWLVVGGHYDHNGYGMFGTTPDRGPLFPGADDNASGTAGVLILADLLAKRYADTDSDEPLRSVLFLCFDAEERGLHGSRYFAENTPIPASSMTCLLNMDMIGRLRSDNLAVLGTGTAVGMQEILRPHFESSGLVIAETPAGSGRSDDANFNRIGVAGLHFFTGMHPEYTSPRDLASTVNPSGAAKILDLIYSIAIDLATRPDRLRHTEPGRQTRGEDRAYAPVRLGIRPGMGEDIDHGILVESVSDGTSAADGGVKAGDVMIGWDGDDLDGMRTLAEKLRAHKPGDVVTITVDRDGVEHDLSVTLKASDGGQ